MNEIILQYMKRFVLSTYDYLVVSFQLFITILKVVFT